MSSYFSEKTIVKKKLNQKSKKMIPMTPKSSTLKKVNDSNFMINQSTPKSLTNYTGSILFLDWLASISRNIFKTAVNGEILQKFENWSKLYNSAVQNNQVVVSQPFYTNHDGYKMMVSLCPNGDGEFKGRYLSVFFTVMRGSFDAIQEWPFQSKIEITVIDQGPVSENRVNITKTILLISLLINRMLI